MRLIRRAHKRSYAMKYAKEELYGKGSVLNDDGEEAALDASLSHN